jgi:hypothetical protein
MDWPGTEPDLRGERLVTNHLSHGTANTFTFTRRLLLQSFLKKCCSCGSVEELSFDLPWTLKHLDNK